MKDMNEERGYIDIILGLMIDKEDDITTFQDWWTAIKFADGEAVDINIWDPDDKSSPPKLRCSIYEVIDGVIDYESVEEFKSGNVERLSKKYFNLITHEVLS
jgi:hypothetical protein